MAWSARNIFLSLALMPSHLSAFTLKGISQQRHTRLAAREEKYIDIAPSQNLSA
jgi:hypothetical protein